MKRPLIFLALISRVLLAAGVPTLLPRLAVAGPASPELPPLMDRSEEIAMALSACPAAIAQHAAVYVLEKAGYVRVRDSTNGFTAIVQHALAITREPQCMDAEGTRTLLPRILKVAELRAQGKPTDEIDRFVAAAYAHGEFQYPQHVGIDYMLSTKNVVVVDPKHGVVAPYPPHVMFYAPYLTNAVLGSDGNVSGPAFVASEGSPQALIIVPLGGQPATPHMHSDSPANNLK